MVSAILAARHRTFVLVVTSLFVLFVFPMHNKFLLLLLLYIISVHGGADLDSVGAVVEQSTATNGTQDRVRSVVDHIVSADWRQSLPLCTANHIIRH